MTKLASVYARATGLRLSHPDLQEAFFPHPFESYITIQTGTNQPAKVYSHWQEVIALVKPILDANRIAVLHLGGKDDPILNGAHDLRGKTTYAQSAYIVKRALCHVGNDSWLVHLAGMYHRPLVALYGSTSAANHGPYWCDTAKTVLIESHRAGGVPTYVSHEAPKTIDYIRPEQVANSLLRLLGISDTIPHKTCFIGQLYQHAILELVPNTCPAPGFCPELPVTVRMDLLFNEAVLVQLLQTGRKVHIITKAVLDINLLVQAKTQILSYSHEIVAGQEPTLQYADVVKSLFPGNHAFFTRVTDEKTVADLRFRFFDHVNVSVQKDLTKEDYVNGVLTYLNLPNTPQNRVDIEAKMGDTRFKTNKYVLSNGKVHLSHAHAAANESIDSMASNAGKVIDVPDLWKDQSHFLITHV